ncbi:hypothetical protein [Caballeronia sp. 15711]|uniref:hypothetical protein n=1 Tax=Caballeronia sp. 15711 TaxID=3391029 RepID=UPI0039E3C519
MALIIRANGVQLMAGAVPTNRAGVLSAVEAFIPTIPPNKPGGNKHVLSRPVQDFRRRRWRSGLARHQTLVADEKYSVGALSRDPGLLINVWISENAKIRSTG